MATEIPDGGGETIPVGVVEEERELLVVEHKTPNDNERAGLNAVAQANDKVVEDRADNNNNNEASLLEVVTEFSKQTSIGGLLFLFDWEHHVVLWRRWIWFPILVVLTGWMIYSLYELVTDYRTHSLNVSEEWIYPNALDFPQVTVCNLNRYIEQAIQSTGIQEPRNSTEVVQLSMPLEQSILFTRFNDEYYTTMTEAWVPTITPFGYCFEFQTNDAILVPGHHHYFHNHVGGGGGAGLYFGFDLHQESYDSANARIAGVQVFVTQRGARITELDTGIILSPGVEATIGITKTQWKRQEQEPWSRCTGIAPQYIQSVCRSDCIDTLIIEECNCRRLGDTTTTSGSIRYCQDQDYNCFQQFVPTSIHDAVVEDENDNNILSKDLLCDCWLPPCQEETYETNVAMARFAQVQLEYWANALTTTETPRQLETNWINISINYEQIQFEIKRETIAMTTQQLWSDIGGTMSLFLGMSFVSIFELVGDFFLLRLIPRWLWCREDQRRRYYYYGLGGRY